MCGVIGINWFLIISFCVVLLCLGIIFYIKQKQESDPNLNKASKSIKLSADNAKNQASVSLSSGVAAAASINDIKSTI